MRFLFDFQCEHCGNMDEKFVDSEVKTVPCTCGYPMHRVICTPTVSLEGISGSFPGAHDHWARIREEKFRRNIKLNYDNGE